MSFTTNSTKKTMKTIALCASVSAYPRLKPIYEYLTSHGWEVLVPLSAQPLTRGKEIELTGEVTVAGKQKAMYFHCENILKSDAILVVNLDKHGVTGYIGPNVLMEIGLAFAHRKKIFILNKTLTDNAFADELEAMMPVYLAGDIKKIVTI